VIAKLRPRAWRVVLGVGVGHLNGGIETDWKEDDLPPEARRPNATFFVTVVAGCPPGECGPHKCGLASR
jgi:hypothetical protein